MDKTIKQYFDEIAKLESENNKISNKIQGNYSQLKVLRTIEDTDNDYSKENADLSKQISNLEDDNKNLGKEYVNNQASIDLAKFNLLNCSDCANYVYSYGDELDNSSEHAVAFEAGSIYYDCLNNEKLRSELSDDVKNHYKKIFLEKYDAFVNSEFFTKVFNNSFIKNAQETADKEDEAPNDKDVVTEETKKIVNKKFDNM